MKTSNYITISFFVFLFGGIFILFLAAKIDPRGSLHQEFLKQEKALDNFSVVVAEAGADIRLKSGQTPKMSLNFLKGDSCKFPPFIVRNDTLFVSSFSGKAKHRTVEVDCKDINTIQGKDTAKIWVEQFHSDTLNVKLNKSDFRYSSNKENAKSLLLKVEANQSKINIWDSNFDEIEILLNQTEMRGNFCGSLSGSLKDHSNLSAGASNRINLETDSTSTYRLDK